MDWSDGEFLAVMPAAGMLGEPSPDSTPDAWNGRHVKCM